MLGSKSGLNKKELEEIYSAYFESLRNFLYYKVGDTDLAEDMVQEIFITLWKKRDTVRIETVKSLLFTIANNQVINYFKHMKVVKNHEVEIERQESREFRTPEFEYEVNEFADKLNCLIEKLPTNCREVFLMNRIDKLKYAEIAERLSLSVKAVEKRMSKALGIIKKDLGRTI